MFEEWIKVHFFLCPALFLEDFPQFCASLFRTLSHHKGLGGTGAKFGPKLADDGYGNLARLCKLHNLKLEGMLYRHGATPAEVREIVDAVEDARFNLI